MDAWEYFPKVIKRKNRDIGSLFAVSRTYMLFLSADFIR